jgi:hypothetical protein
VAIEAEVKLGLLGRNGIACLLAIDCHERAQDGEDPDGPRHRTVRRSPAFASPDLSAPGWVLARVVPFFGS